MKLTVKVIPRSARDEIIGTGTDGSVKIKLTAPPTDGQANAALVKLLAKKYHRRQNDIKIISGLTSRKKIVSIAD